MTNKNISRGQWEQIASRVRKTDFEFDPKWKCLIDGLQWDRCAEHNEEDMADIIEAIRVRETSPS